MKKLMFPRLIRILSCLLMAAGATLVHAVPPPPDLLAGDWLYYKDRQVRFNADGTADGPGSRHGTWEYLHNPEVQRHYRIIWDQGKSIENLILTEDGQRAHVSNQLAPHNQYNVRRSIPDKPPAAAGPEDPADPLAGPWRWRDGRLMVFRADGTATASKGPDGTWTALQVGRKYRVDWGHGQYIDTISIDPSDPQTAQVESDKGGRYAVRRAAPTEYAAVPAAAARSAPDKPVNPAASPNYFGRPGQ